MLRLRSSVALVVVAAGCAPAVRTATGDVAPAAPASARQLVERMHGDWTGKWYETLELRQVNTTYTSVGEQTSEWLQRQQVPGRLRIDFVSPQANGSGLLYRGDSVYTFDAGVQARAVEQRNPLLLLTADVYALSSDTTMATLAGLGVDTTQLRLDTWNDRPVLVMGAPPGDSTSTQLWVDAERMLLRRLIWSQAAGDRTVVTEYHLTYQDVGGFTVPQEIVLLRRGRPYLRERYVDVRPNVPLDPALFDPAQWARGALVR